MNIKWIQKYILLFVKSATSRRIYENEIKWQYTNDWNYSNVHDLCPRDFHYSVKPPCTVNRASNLIAWNQGGPVYIPGKLQLHSLHVSPHIIKHEKPKDWKNISYSLPLEYCYYIDDEITYCTQWCSNHTKHLSTILLSNAGSDYVTLVASYTWMAISLGQIEARLIHKHYVLPLSIHMPMHSEARWKIEAT